MGAAKSNLTIEQGATFQIALNFNGAKNLDGSLGPPIDVSDWSFTGQLRSNFSSPVDIQAFTFNVGDASNQIIVSLSATQSGLIPVNPVNSVTTQSTNYAYDIFATLADEVTVLKILYGNAILIPRVTQ